MSKPTGLRYNDFVHPTEREDRDFRLEDWLVQPSLGRVSNPAGEVQLEPRAMELLVFLAEHAGSVVSRRQILDAVWQTEFVSDATVSGTVKKLRRALGDDARNPRYIETLSKRGYRLLPRPLDMLEVVAGPGGAFRIGDWLVEPSRNRMSKGNFTVELEHGTMDVLLCLAERAGEPVPSRELIDLVNRDDALPDTPIDRRIAELQQALGDSATGTDYIENVPDLGYRLAAAVGAAQPSATVTPFPGLRAEPERPVFVARETELASLNDFVQQTLAGEGQAAFVIGEAGTGKTALIQEFVDRALDAHGELVAAVGVCSAQTGIGDAYGPWRQLLALLTGDFESAAAPGFATAATVRRLRTTALLTAEAVAEVGRDLVGTLIPGAALLARTEAAVATRASWVGSLRELVRRKASLPPDAALQQAAVFMQVARVLAAVARRRPLLLVLEDLHWADAGSIALLFSVSRELAGHRILVLGSYRPTDVALGRGSERHPLEPVVAELRGRHSQLAVELDRVGNRAFVDALVDSEPNRLGEGFRENLFRQTAGHALFTVEVLRTLQDRGTLARDPEGRWFEAVGVDWTALPARVEGVLGGRVDRLSSELRELASVASVEGEEFSAEVVARVLGADIRETTRLLSRELATRHRLVRARGVRTAGAGRRSVFGFSHVLFQRYLYTLLDEVERVRLHEDVAAALEALHADDTEEVAVRLARHFEEAGLIERALHFLLQAGTRATRMTATQEALGHLTKALELLATLPGSDERDRTELALQLAIQVPLMATIGWGGAEVARSLERAQELADRVGDDTKKAWVLYLSGSLFSSSGKTPEIEGVAHRLGELASTMDDEVLQLLAHLLGGYSRSYTGRLEDGRADFEQALGLFDRGRHHWIAHAISLDPEVAAAGHLSWALARMGRLDQGLDMAESGLDISEQLGHPPSSCLALCMAFYCHFHRQELEPATRCAEGALTIATEHGYLPWAMWARTWLGMACVARAEFADGIARIEGELPGLRHIGLEFGRIIHLCSLAEGRLGCGRAEEALATLDEAAQEIEDHGERFWEPEVHRLRGQALRAAGDPSGAETSYLKAVEIARDQGARTFELQAATSLARLLRDQDRTDEARNALAPVVGWFTEGLDTPLLIEARELLDELGLAAQNE